MDIRADHVVFMYKGPEVGQSQGPFKKHLFSSLIVLLNAKKSMSLKDFTLQNLSSCKEICDQDDNLCSVIYLSL